MKLLQLPNGMVAGIRTMPLHRRYRHARGFATYSRPTDWVAMAGFMMAWGRTQREAIARLHEMAAAEPDKILVNQ